MAQSASNGFDIAVIVAAGIAAVAAVATLLGTLVSNKRSWQRDQRLRSYAEFMAASVALFKTAQKAELVPTKTMDVAEEVKADEGRFEAALATVLILGPKDVSRRASLFEPIIERTAHIAEPGALSTGELQELFARAANEFIVETSKTIGKKQAQEDVKLDVWRQTTATSLPQWPEQA